MRITRDFKAPRPLVFSCWSSADKLRQWSGCKECTHCEVVMDFRVGGSFTQKMQLAVNGGTCEFTVSGPYTDIVEPERIAYDAMLGPVRTHVTIEFLEQGPGTRVVITHDGLPDEFFGSNVAQGTTESFDKLEVWLASNALAPAR